MKTQNTVIERFQKMKIVASHKIAHINNVHDNVTKHDNDSFTKQCYILFSINDTDKDSSELPIVVLWDAILAKNFQNLLTYVRLKKNI